MESLSISPGYRFA